MTIESIFLVVGAIILTGFAALLINRRTKIPDSLFLIIFGLAIGPVFGFVDSTLLANYLPIVSSAAMIVILVDSGISFDISKILGMFRTAAAFTLLVAVLTTLFITGVLVYFFSWEPLQAALLGLISSGTTTITAMALIKGMGVKGKVKRLIMLETILNDFTLVFGAFMIIDLIQFATFDLSFAVISFFLDFFFAIISGFLFCIAWRIVLQTVRIKSIRRQLNYASTLGVCLLLYYFASFIGGNPIIAVFTFSLLLGNYSKVCRFLNSKNGFVDLDTNGIKDAITAIKNAQVNFTFFMKAFFFVLLGATFSFEVLAGISVYLILGIITMILLARFLSTFFLSWMDRAFSKYRSLITFMVPRGYVAAVLAFIPEQYGIKIPYFTDIVVILVVTTTFVAISGASVFGRRKRK